MASIRGEGQPAYQSANLLIFQLFGPAWVPGVSRKGTRGTPWHYRSKVRAESIGGVSPDLIVRPIVAPSDGGGRAGGHPPSD